MTPIRICAAAETDYVEALSRYAERSIDAAVGFEADFEAALARIADGPDRFPPADDRHRYCSLRRYPFRILFRRETSGEITVISVAHAARRPDFWRGR